MRMRQRLVSVFTSIVIVGALTLILLRGFVLDTFEIVSGSMSETLSIGDRVLSLRPSALRSDGLIDFHFTGVLRRMDIVIFYEDGKHDPLVKRVIGLPGERVMLGPSGVTIDGRLLDEPYLTPGDVIDTEMSVDVPPGNLFLLGDRRQGSRDSRSFGCIDRSLVRGKVAARYFPLDVMRLF